MNFVAGDDPFPQDEKTVTYLLGREVNLQHTWREMERMMEKGKVRSIGPSNFRQDLVEGILSGSVHPLHQVLGKSLTSE